MLTRTRPPDPRVAFGALAVIALAVLMVEGRKFTFQGDEWDFLMHRRGHSLAVFLTPHNEHLSALPILAYKVLFGIFGARSTVPFRLLDALLATLCATLVFVLVARRMSGWVALAAGAVMLFFGPGWQDILWGFQIGYLGSLAAGLGALLVLERGDRRGDVIAAALFIVSIACSSVGLVMLIGGIVEMLLMARGGAWRRLWVVVLPAALYALWYSHYGVSRVQLTRAHAIPLWAFDGLSATVGSITGLTQPSAAAGPYSVTLDPGTTIAVVVLIALGIRFLRGGPLQARFWGLAAAAVAFWSLDAMSYVPGRDPGSSKYVYPLAAFVLVAAAACWRGYRVPRRGLVLLGVVSLAAIASNLGFLRDGAKEFNRDSVYAKAELGAMQVARGIVSPSFSPAAPAIAAVIGNPNVTQIDARSYFAATDTFGSPADSVTTLLRQSDAVRQAADLVLVNAEQLALRPASLPARGCMRSQPVAGTIQLASGPGNVVLHPVRAGISRVSLRRFASTYMSAAVGPVAAGATVALSLPHDRAALPWHVGITVSTPVVACGLTAAQ
jgi:hypothetical protein